MGRPMDGVLMMGWEAVAGTYYQSYSGGHIDSTVVSCVGTMTWRASTMQGELYSAGTGLPPERAAQNSLRLLRGPWGRDRLCGSHSSGRGGDFCSRGSP